MSSPLLSPLTVLFVSPNGRPSSAGTALDDVDPALDVVVAASTDRALDRIEDGAIDCVICEHVPPYVDCVAFVADVRERDPVLPVLVLPGDGGEDCTRQALAAGATDVVETSAKSMSSAILANRIRQFVRSTGGTGPPRRPSTADGPRRDASSGTTTDEVPVGRFHDVFDQLGNLVRRDAVADVIADLVADVLDVPGVGVFLFDDEENHLRPAAITDPMADYYGGELVFGPGKPDSITWHAFVTGETELYDDLRTADSRVNDDTAARSTLFVPLGEHGVLVAATNVTGAFSTSTRELVELVAAMAESALDRIASVAVLRQRDRRFREQNDRLEHLERITGLVRSVDRAVVAESTREDVEEAVLDAVVGEEWFDFGWIGTVDPDSGELTPRHWTGDGSQYLDDLSLAVATSDEPSCRTARQRDVTVAPNVAENLAGGWERDALAQDFHSVLSVPIEYEGILYGVLTVYADRPNGFRESLVSALEQVGETSGYAINATERTMCMVSNGVTELEIEIESPADVLNVVADAIGTTVECLELTRLSDGSTKVLFSAPDVPAESVLATTAGLVEVEDVEHVAGDDPHLYTAVVTGQMVGSTLGTSGGVPERITADGTSLVAAVSVPESVDVRTFVGRLERRYPETNLLARRERDRSTRTRMGFHSELEATLTDRQMEVLETAYEEGFFRSPRDATGQDVADELGVSQPTVSHHLRAGQGKLFSLLFDVE